MYCTANTDVKAFCGFPQDFTSSTTPALTDINVLISEIESEINTYLYSIGISSPTNTTLLGMLGKQASIGVSGWALMRYGKSDADFRRAEKYISQYDDFLKKLLDSEGLKNTLMSLNIGSVENVIIESNMLDGTFSSSSVELQYSPAGFVP